MNGAIKPSLTEAIFKKLNYILLTCFSLMIILPFINILALSLNSGMDASAGGIYFWPRVFTLENYAEILSNKAISTAYIITIVRTITGTFLSVLLTGMAAYGLKCRTLPGRNAIMAFLVFTMLFSGGMIPYYLLLKNLHLTRSFFIYIIPFLYSVWNIIIMRSFLRQSILVLKSPPKLTDAMSFRYFSVLLCH